MPPDPSATTTRSTSGTGRGSSRAASTYAERADDRRTADRNHVRPASVRPQPLGLGLDPLFERRIVEVAAPTPSRGRAARRARTLPVARVRSSLMPARRCSRARDGSPRPPSCGRGCSGGRLRSRACPRLRSSASAHRYSSLRTLFPPPRERGDVVALHQQPPRREAERSAEAIHGLTRRRQRCERHGRRARHHGCLSQPPRGLSCRTSSSTARAVAAGTRSSIRRTSPIGADGSGEYRWPGNSTASSGTIASFCVRLS